MKPPFPLSHHPPPPNQSHSGLTLLPFQVQKKAMKVKRPFQGGLRKPESKTPTILVSCHSLNKKMSQNQPRQDQETQEKSTTPSNDWYRQ